MLRLILASGVVLAALSVAAPAQAATITQSLSVKTGRHPVGTVLPTTSFDQFDPALGTLESVTAELTVSGQTSVYVDLYLRPDNNVTSHVYSARDFIFSSTLTLSGTVSRSAAEAAAYFGPVTGTGTATLFLGLGTLGAPLLNIQSSTGSIVYTYTPVSVSVPEPASALLLGAGLLGVAALRRRGAGTA